MLRRSAFKPKPVLRREATQYTGSDPSAPRAPGLRIVAAPSIVSPIPKSAVIRNEGYRRWVATLPCVCCQIEGYSQAAHPNQGRGLGQKASDLEVFALCSTRPGHMGCHVMHDTLIDMSLEMRRGLERVYIAKTQALARAAGRKEFA